MQLTTRQERHERGVDRAGVVVTDEQPVFPADDLTP
jgi:hypothetical protein